MKETAFGVRLVDETALQWRSVRSFVLRQLGISDSLVATPENFIKLANTLYELNVSTDAPFADAVRELHELLTSMTKNARRTCRKRNFGKIGYEVYPRSAALRRAVQKARAKKSAAKPRERQPSPAAIKSREEYRAKHLVLVTKDGTQLFDNVKQHATKDLREAFYRSWEWRQLRMKVIKKHARRCMCCGSRPNDLTVDGQPVRLVVDHIKPISKYWHLRLVPSNLQILCDECNMGKGAWDETDHRTDEQKSVQAGVLA
jgi:5-methylcytosine-specific restriction endonuclease McrA